MNNSVEVGKPYLYHGKIVEITAAGNVNDYDDQYRIVYKTGQDNFGAVIGHKQQIEQDFASKEWLDDHQIAI